MGQQFAIIRTEKHKTWGTLGKSMGHTMRTSMDERQHLNEVPEPVRILAGSANWLEEWHQQVDGMHLRNLQQGATHTLAREFFLGMSPEWAQSKSRKEIDAWAETNIAWLNERFGKERVKFAALHLDEQTPHIAAYVVPLKADLNRKGEPNARGNGWTLSDVSLGLGGNKAALVKLQDEYAEAMKPLKLQRGRRRSKALHRTTAQWRAQMATPLDNKITRPKVEVPDPKLGDRLDPKPYAEAAAKKAAQEAASAVFKQMEPYRKQAQEQTKELGRLRTMVEHLEPLAELLKDILRALLGHEPNLNTLEGQKQAKKAIKSLKGVLADASQPPKAQQAAAADPVPELMPPRQQRAGSRGPSPSPR